MPENNTNAGHFSFCENCPSHLNCCTGNKVDMPLLTPEDATRISSTSGLPPEEFCSSTGGKLFKMKAREGSCHFYEDGKCMIYGERPIDCRIFPFDVDYSRKEGLVLIAYTSTCPKEIDVHPCVDHVRELIPALEPHTQEFALSTSERMELHQSQPIMKIQTPSSDR